MASINDCPPEILTEIFKFYVRSGSSPVCVCSSECVRSNKKKSYLFLPAPVLLSHVCVSWRILVNHLPILWDRLQITVPKAYPKPKLVKTWLARSGSLPLSLNIQAFQANLKSSKSLAKSYLDCLTPSCERWRSITLNVHFVFLQHLFQDSRIRFPMLETLYLRSEGINQRTRFRSLEDAPKLSDFSFTTSLSAPIGADVSFAASGITVLFLRGISHNPATFLSIMLSCHHLQYCEVHLPDDTNDALAQIGPSQMVKLHHLDHLEVWFVGRFGCPWFLDNLFVPNMDSFTIGHTPSNVKWTSDLDDDIVPCLLRFINRSQPHLHELTLDRIIPMGVCCLSGLLENFPCLRSLTLRNCFFPTENLCYILTIHPDLAYPLLSNLRELELVQDPHYEQYRPKVQAANHGFPRYLKNTITDLVYSRWFSIFSEDEESLENSSDGSGELSSDDDDSTEDSSSSNPDSSDISESDDTALDEESDLFWDEDFSARLESLVVSRGLLTDPDRRRLRALQKRGMPLEIV